MNTSDFQEMIAKLQEDLKGLKETEPEKYLELLKTLNEGVRKINIELDNAVGKESNL